MNTADERRPKIINIMIVDDELSIRKLASLILRNEGYCVHEAVNGIEAIDMLAGSDIHMVITDVLMPKMDGIRLVRELRKAPQTASIPVVMMTSRRSSLRTRQEGELAGVNDWIFKPLLHHQLAETVRKYSS